MDSQHRHELAENELAHWLEDFIAKVKPFASLILISVVGLVAVVTAWGYYQKTNVQGRAAEWSMFTSTTLEGVPDMNALETASTELDGAGAPADFASITWAEGKLYQASETVLTDRQKATAAIDEARQEFERLLLAKGVLPVIRQRAQFGLARSYELDGDFEKAIEAYKKTTGAFAEMAAERAEDLAKPGANDDLQWLAAAQAPEFTMPSGPGIPGQQPDFSPDDLDLGAAAGDDEPEITFDDLLKGTLRQGDTAEGGAGEDGASTEEAAASDGPAMSDETATPEEPADEPPAAESDASAETDSAESDAEEQPEDE